MSGKSKEGSGKHTKGGRPRTSPVWQHFHQESNGTVVCRILQKGSDEKKNVYCGWFQTNYDSGNGYSTTVFMLQIYCKSLFVEQRTCGII